MIKAACDVKPHHCRHDHDNYLLNYRCSSLTYDSLDAELELKIFLFLTHELNIGLINVSHMLHLRVISKLRQ